MEATQEVAALPISLPAGIYIELLDDCIYLSYKLLGVVCFRLILDLIHTLYGFFSPSSYSRSSHTIYHRTLHHRLWSLEEKRLFAATSVALSEFSFFFLEIALFASRILV